LASIPYSLFCSCAQVSRPLTRLAYIRPPIRGQYRSRVLGGGPWGRRRAR